MLKKYNIRGMIGYGLGIILVLVALATYSTSHTIVVPIVGIVVFSVAFFAHSVTTPSRRAREYEEIGIEGALGKPLLWASPGCVANLAVVFDFLSPWNYFFVSIEAIVGTVILVFIILALSAIPEAIREASRTKQIKERDAT